MIVAMFSPLEVVALGIPLSMLLLVAYLMGWITRRIAMGKGLPARSYFWAGFFFGPIAILIALLMPLQNRP
jgi:hypothetical protein